MSNIQISNLSFQYEGSFDTIFDQVNLHLDTTWKLGFIGRNGRGKTTFLKILAGQLPCKGEIHASVPTLYFPYAVHDEQRTQMAIEVAQTVNPLAEDWEIIRELTLLQFDIEHLYLPYQQLSNGEQTKLLLASLFAGEARFLLIDEPTNHLDDEAREAVSHYLQQKSGYILVSHDRKLLDSCIEHVLALNKANIELQQGNFSSWYENKKRQEQFEIQKNESLKKEIKRIGQSARQKAGWSDQVEATKIGHGVADHGFVGHKVAKMMKRSKVQEARMNQAIEDKKKLLKNVEEVEQLTVPILDFPKKRMIYVENLNIYFNYHALYENPVSFEVN
ncbi:ATP-binding cassette domain-containing protein [Enterococcus cecorum]|uniref:ATP-binding cassette domain-containing protein n=1 Tax=Enterococcus cecorum TaxID=44008 RepID=UPI003F92FF09